MGNYNESVNKIVDLADQQINKGMSALHTEIDSWERRRQAILTTVEQEIEQLSKRYSEEIVQVCVRIQILIFIAISGPKMDRNRAATFACRTTSVPRRTNGDSYSN
jgi:hypothetical protein